MRQFFICSVLLLAACSPGSSAQNEAAVAPANLMGDEPALSPAAAEAKKVVETYFTALREKRYADAWALWRTDGPPIPNAEGKFAKSFAIFSSYDPVAGDPTEIKARDGFQFVVVQAQAKVRIKATGMVKTHSGTVLLKRSANPNEPDPEKRVWRIWGSDIRMR